MGDIAFPLNNAIQFLQVQDLWILLRLDFSDRQARVSSPSSEAMCSIATFVTCRWCVTHCYLPLSWQAVPLVPSPVVHTQLAVIYLSRSKQTGECLWRRLRLIPGGWKAQLAASVTWP